MGTWSLLSLLGLLFARNPSLFTGRNMEPTLSELCAIDPTLVPLRRNVNLPDTCLDNFGGGGIYLRVPSMLL